MVYIFRLIEEVYEERIVKEKMKELKLTFEDFKAFIPFDEGWYKIE